ncbi:putative Phenylacetic acid degradation protein PAAI [Sulfitobacter noctilucae]|uniref:PaaI family thioesterase n=1 Tax=Sulfitobacter noctilucae TaxID=1342302 RepID=UPI000468A3E6|nr:PaaI family thioesterase [Sulfitobacter noctilucae]KIN60260.1 putative Phenylacetic acid degradation protein PAAI [Sulfitobacter noctilucae]
MEDSARARIRSSFAAQTMMATLGAELIEIDAGLIRIAAPILPGSQQQQGFGHAGLTFAIGDSAAGYAALTMLPPDNEVVTAEIKINLLAPARGDRLVATGRVVKPGKRLCVVTSEVHAEHNGASTLIAILQGTMVPVPA